MCEACRFLSNYGQVSFLNYILLMLCQCLPVFVTRPPPPFLRPLLFLRRLLQVFPRTSQFLRFHNNIHVTQFASSSIQWLEVAKPLSYVSAPLCVSKSNSEGKPEPKGTGWEISLKAFDPQN